MTATDIATIIGVGFPIFLGVIAFVGYLITIHSDTKSCKKSLQEIKPDITSILKSLEEGKSRMDHFEWEQARTKDHLLRTKRQIAVMKKVIRKILASLNKNQESEG